MFRYNLRQLPGYRKRISGMRGWDFIAGHSGDAARELRNTKAPVARSLVIR